MKYEVGLYLREQRHIFGICPDCGQITRLSDIQVSYRGKYVPDWKDKIDKKLEYWENKLGDYESKRDEEHAKAIERARKTLLPKMLDKLFPLMRSQGIQPEDVKVILHPLDFIGFDGMNTEESVKRILMLESKSNQAFRKELQTSIQNTIDNGKYDWNLLRVDNTGEITIE
jgi:predicted Holliday junction resolvase-like endonuclease